MHFSLRWLAVAAALLQMLPAASSGQATRDVVDATGRAVRIPAQVNRIADAWHANNAMVLMLGGAEKIVATTVQAQR